MYGSRYQTMIRQGIDVDRLELCDSCPFKMKTQFSNNNRSVAATTTRNNNDDDDDDDDNNNKSNNNKE